MKRVLYIILFLFIYSTSFAGVRITGYIKNIEAKTSAKFYYSPTLMELENVVVFIDSNNHIDFTIDKYYENSGWLIIGNSIIRLFILDDKLIQFNVDYLEFKNSLTFKGDLANENNFNALEDKNNINEEINSYSNYSDGTIFKNHVYKTIALNKKLWEDYPKQNLDSNFVTSINTSLKYKHINALWMYKIGYNPKENKFFEKFTAPDYFNFLDSIEINNDNVVGNSDYSTALMRYFHEKVDKNSLKNLPESYSNSTKFKISFLTRYNYRKSVLSGESLEFALIDLIKLSIKSIDSTNNSLCDSIYNDYLSFANNAETKKWLFNYFKKLDKLNTIFQAPNFTLLNIKGKNVSLSDLKGKVIYVDFWATWCVPCLANMPYSKKLSKKLKDQKNIVFLYINIEDDYSRWKAYIVKNKPEGIQLYANSEWSSELKKKYYISGIPHYVLIGKNGELININASDPSFAETEILNAIK